ncbi:MAG: glycosyltransferase involved in cell wall biosynthesis [Paraglaciecola sp.]|jgi:glycosyltransferase involved in cell wall biosynthesis
MKILYHHRIASKDGQYVHIEEIIKALKKQGHEIILVAPSMGEEQDFGGDGGLVSQLKSKLPKWLYEIIEFTYSFWALAKLATAIVKHKPDFIYERYNLMNPSGIWAKKWFGLPLLLEINAPLLEERSKYDGVTLKGLARWTEHYTWRNADYVLPVTNVLAQYQRDIGVPEKRIRVIPNGINQSEFIDKQHANPLKVDVSDKIVVGFVGFCRDWHGLDKIVKLLAQPGNEKLFFLLVGDGPAVAGIKKIAKDSGIEDRIFVTGLVNREDMPAWLGPIDIALQPAVVDYASPLKMLEYMATGKAIVAPKQANIEELLTDGENALLFDPQDQHNFVNACDALMRDDALRKKLSVAAKQSIFDCNLTWDGNAETIVGLAKTLTLRG